MLCITGKGGEVLKRSIPEEYANQGVTKRCRLSWLTNSALVHEPKCGGGGCCVSANEYICSHGAQINFGDLTPYLTYDANLSSFNCNIVILLNQCKEKALTYRRWRFTKAESIVCECLGKIDFFLNFAPGLYRLDKGLCTFKLVKRRHFLSPRPFSLLLCVKESPRHCCPVGSG
jgi:hypothetical protein